MLALILHFLLIAVLSVRVMLRDDLSPDARVAWVATLALLPFVGALLYFLFGETNLGRRVVDERQRVFEFLNQRERDDAGARAILGDPDNVARDIALHWQAAFRYAASVNGFQPVPGNHGELMADGDAARARMLADMDAATREIDVLYYIWLDDHTGNAVAEALIRAAQRGVLCRAMVDGLGSRALLATPLWQRLRTAGVHVATALPIGHPLRVMLTSRIDLRNHRKITLIDGAITYVGSQNCADAAFRVKAKYAPWVDIMLRLQGPVVTQMQVLFASDWMQSTGQEYDPCDPRCAPLEGGFPALVLGDGPTERARATPQLVALLIGAAQRELIISTPYFVPDITVMDALCAAAWRGVRVTLIFPQRNDSWIVAAASRSRYHALLKSGCAIHEYRGGLLHAKTLTVDGQVTLIGSTNLDLRSFDLNYENNVLLQDPTTTASVRARQMAYVAQSDVVTLDQVRAWPWNRRLWNNLLAAMGPVL